MEDMSDKVEGVRSRVAESLESAADSVRAAADESATAINDLANQAGKKLDSSAKCVRTWGGGRMVGSLRKKVNRKPLQSLAVALGVGLVAGAVWRSTR